MEYGPALRMVEAGRPVEHTQEEEDGDQTSGNRPDIQHTAMLYHKSDNTLLYHNTDNTLQYTVLQNGIRIF